VQGGAGLSEHRVHRRALGVEHLQGTAQGRGGATGAGGAAGGAKKNVDDFDDDIPF